MSTSLVCAQSATGFPDVFVQKIGPAELLKNLSAAPHLSRVTAASRLDVRPSPEMASSGIAEFNALTGGLPRGCLTEIYGPSSSGRTALLLAALAAATLRGEACALVDISNALDPHSASATGMEFKNLLWIRCGAQHTTFESEQSFSELQSSSASLTLPPASQEDSSSRVRSPLLSPDPLGEKHLEVRPRTMMGRVRTENMKPHQIKNFQAQQPGQFGIDHAQRKLPRSYQNKNPGRVGRNLGPHTAHMDLSSKSFARNTARTSKEWENRKLERTKEWSCLEQALKATDLLLQSGGFGMVVIDLSDVPEKFASRIPLTSWFRFRRAVENTSTVLLVIAQAPCARTCASLLLRLAEQPRVFYRRSSEEKIPPETNSAPDTRLSINNPTHAQLLNGLQLHLELLRSRMESKPVRSAQNTLTSKTAWAG